MTRYNINDYSKGINGFGLTFCDTIYSVTLAADTVTNVTIPGNSGVGPAVYTTEYFLVLMSYEEGTTVWVANNQTAAAPVGDTFALSTSEINPDGRLVKAGDVLSFLVEDTTAEISVAIYSFLQS